MGILNAAKLVLLIPCLKLNFVFGGALPKFNIEVTKSIAGSVVDNQIVTLSFSAILTRGPQPLNEDADEDDTDDDRTPKGPRYIAVYSTDGKPLKTQGPQSLSVGHGFTWSLTTTNLHPSTGVISNAYAVSLFKVHGRNNARRLIQKGSYKINVLMVKSNPIPSVTLPTSLPTATVAPNLCPSGNCPRVDCFTPEGTTIPCRVEQAEQRR